MPSLRDRKQDIPVLVEYFIHRYARKAHKTFRRVNKKTLDRLQSYPWPGNVRELQNVIERSVIVCDTDEFTVDESWLSTGRKIGGAGALSSKRSAYEKAIIEEARARAADGCSGQRSGRRLRDSSINTRIAHPRAADQQEPLSTATHAGSSLARVSRISPLAKSRQVNDASRPLKSAACGWTRNCNAGP